MSEPIRTVAIHASRQVPETSDCLQLLFATLTEKGIGIHLTRLLEERLSASIRKEYAFERSFSAMDELSPMPDIMISVGGDGTFLETVNMVGLSNVPIAGINVGRLGFLANIAREHLKEALLEVLERKYKVVNRSLLRLESSSNQLFKRNLVALNEITLQKSDFNMITIHVHMDGEFLNTYWADGLIISTATGSTAYNLSSGGPIVTPESDAMIISPIAPHNLTIRPLVIPGKHVLHLRVEGRTTDCLVTCDYHSARMDFSEHLKVTQAGYRVRTIQPEGQSFFSTLRNKLMWGADKRN